MSISDDIAGAAAVTIPEGAVKKITRKADSAVIWEKPVTISAVLNDNDWATIRAVSDAGQAANYWNIGDRKGVTLNGKVSDGLTLNNYTCYCFIIGFDHNSEKEGANRIHFQFGFNALSGGKQIAFVDSGYKVAKTSGAWFNMKLTQTNTGGWKNSLLRSQVMNSIKNCLPSDLETVLKTVTKYTDNTGGGTESEANVTQTTDTIFILSVVEARGYYGYSNRYETNYQKRYAYYDNGNLVFYKHSDGSSAVIWWLRSPYVYNSNSKSFNTIYENGANNAHTATYSLGIAPAFCV